MINKNQECKTEKCKTVKKIVCWQGFEKGQCPRRRLENEKLFFGMLLTIATGVLIWMQF